MESVRPILMVFVPNVQGDSSSIGIFVSPIPKDVFNMVEKIVLIVETDGF